MVLTWSKRTRDYKPYLSWFCWFGLIWVIFLLYAGGFTTSIKAGMAFLDWPLSNGSLNPEGWLEHTDQRAEHSHRLLGMKIGLITLILLIWVHIREARKWVRSLAIGLFAAVVFQGILGGLRVKLDQLNLLTESNGLAQTFAVLHACGGQIVLCIFVTMALVLSRSWIQLDKFHAIEVPGNVKQWCWIIFIATVLQLLTGAVMRHWDAGLAIPAFPLMPDHTLLPKTWSFPVAIHFAHRAGALVLFVLVLICTMKLVSIRERPASWRILIGMIHGLIFLQIFLGATIIWSYKNPYAATLHVVIGAFFLATVGCLNLQVMHHVYLKKSSLLTHSKN